MPEVILFRFFVLSLKLHYSLTRCLRLMNSWSISWTGDTGVICAVNGPSEVRMSKELPHRAAIDILFRPKITGSSQMSQLTGWGKIILIDSVTVN